MNITDLNTSHAAFRSALIECLQRTALILPESWRWIQYENAWVFANPTYGADNRLTTYEVIYNGTTVGVNLAYDAVTGYITQMEYISPEGTVRVAVAYDANYNVSGTTVTFL